MFSVAIEKNEWHEMDISSHRWCSVKRNVLKNFANFIGKHLWWSLWQSCFSGKFAKFLKTLILENIWERLLLNGLNFKRVSPLFQSFSVLQSFSYQNLILRQSILEISLRFTKTAEQKTMNFVILYFINFLRSIFNEFIDDKPWIVESQGIKSGLFFPRRRSVRCRWLVL